jgi:hypothetical protein
MGWVTMQMELRLFFYSSHPLLHLGLSTTAWTLVVCRHIPWLHAFLILLWTATAYLLLWTAATYLFVSCGMAWDSLDLHIQLCPLH